MWILFEVSDDPAKMSSQHGIWPTIGGIAVRDSLKLLPYAFHSSRCSLIIFDTVDKLSSKFLLIVMALLDLPNGALHGSLEGERASVAFQDRLTVVIHSTGKKV